MRRKRNKKVIVVLLIFLIALGGGGYALTQFSDEEKDYSSEDSEASGGGDDGIKVESFQRISKVFGSSFVWDTQENISVQNPNRFNVAGTDLGAPTYYKGKLWINLGDTIYDHVNYNGSNPDGPWSGQNFLVAFTDDLELNNGFRVDGYLNIQGGRPKRALVHVNCHIRDSFHGCYSIPNSMFTIEHNGQEYMFAHYMEVQNVAGHDHKIFNSRIAKYNDSTKKFRTYKPETYRWTTTAAPAERFDFGMASFVQRDDYIYMFGSPSGRFGGLKVARINVSDFVNPGNQENWSYWNGSDWSLITKDYSKIRNQAEWVIEPIDPDFNYSKPYSWSDGPKITIAKFSVVYNEYLQKFILITGKPHPGMGIDYYLADNPEGPWTKKVLKANTDRWTYYATYTTDAMLKQNGKVMFFFATTWEPYGVYLYKVVFKKPSLPCAENLSVTCKGHKGVFSWSEVEGADKYLVRINKAPKEDWANPDAGDFSKTVDGTSLETQLESGEEYVEWSVQGIKDSEVYPYPGCIQKKEVSFSCSDTPVCTPSCSGKDCGSDGCGGSCGKCGSGKSCVSGKCLSGESVNVDLDGNGKLDGKDYGIILSDWADYYDNNKLNNRSDLNGNGKIDGPDYTLFLQGWADYFDN